MDAVVTYVNGQDPLWRQDYAGAVGGDILWKRFRDWGTLPFLLRGIEEYMPFVDRVVLVVSRDSQVPSWVSRDTVRVVLHEQFFPEGILPVFNSSAIDMFVHRIPGLSQRYIYFNDDMFPVAPCTEEDFFPGGRPAIGFSRHLIAAGNFRRRVRNCDRLARRAAGAGASLGYIRPQHVPSPMLREECEKLYSIVGEELVSKVSRLRSASNYNQYIYLDYMYFTGKALPRRLSNRHFSLAASSMQGVCSFLRKPTEKFVCINDVQMSEERFGRCRDLLLDTFRAVLPRPSRFEK